MIAAAPQPEPVESELFGTVLVNRESGEVVMFYSPDMVPDISAIKDCFELVDLFATPQPDRTAELEEALNKFKDALFEALIQDTSRDKALAKINEVLKWE